MAAARMKAQSLIVITCEPVHARDLADAPVLFHDAAPHGPISASPVRVAFDGREHPSIIGRPHGQHDMRAIGSLLAGVHGDDIAASDILRPGRFGYAYERTSYGAVASKALIAREGPRADVRMKKPAAGDGDCVPAVVGEPALDCPSPAVRGQDREVVVALLVDAGRP